MLLSIFLAAAAHYAIAPALALALVSLAGAGVKYAQSSKQAKDAKALAASKPRPKYNIPQGEYDSLALLKGRANQGLSGATLQHLDAEADEGLTSTINAVLKGGGDMNATGDVYNRYLNNISRTALADEDARNRNLQLLLAQQSRMTDMEDKEWQVNEFAPYADTQQHAAKMADAAAAGKNDAINSAVGAVGNYVGNLNQQKMIDAIGKKSGGSGSSSLGSMYEATKSYNPKTDTYSNSIEWASLSADQRTILWNIMKNYE